MKNVIYLIAFSLLSTFANASSQPIWQDKANGVEWIYLGNGTYPDAELACSEAGNEWALFLFPPTKEANNPDPNSSWNTKARWTKALHNSPLIAYLKQQQPLTDLTYWVNAPELVATHIRRLELQIQAAELKAKIANLNGNPAEEKIQKSLIEKYGEELLASKNGTYFYLGIAKQSTVTKYGYKTVPIGETLPISSILCMKRLK